MSFDWQGIRDDPAQALAAAALFISFASAAVIVGAFGLEYIGGFPPCPLCLEERLPFYAAIPAGIIGAYLSAKAPKVAAAIVAFLALAFIYNAGLAIYHAGAEWRLWPGPDTCAVQEDLSRAVGSLTERLKSTRPVRCDEAPFRVFWLSPAGYVVLISAGFAGLAGLVLYRARGLIER